MNKKQAIKVSQFLIASYHYTSTSNTIFIDSGHLLEEIIYDKLFLVLNERLGLENSFSNKNVFRLPEKKWTVDAELSHATKNLHIYDGAWTWNRIQGSGDVTYYLESMLCQEIYDIYPLLYSAWTLSDVIYSDSSNDDADYLVPIPLLDEMLCTEDYYGRLNVPDEKQADFRRKVQNEICSLARFIYQTSKEMAYPSDVRYERSCTIVTPDIAIGDYAYDSIEALFNCFFSSISKEAFFCILPQFLLFLYAPSIIIRFADSDSVTFWVYENEQLYSYIKWRENFKETSQLLSTLDQLLQILLQPFGTVDDSSVIQNNVLGKKSAVIWAITNDINYAKSNPCFYPARKVWETLYPIWEKEYLK